MSMVSRREVDLSESDLEQARSRRRNSPAVAAGEPLRLRDLEFTDLYFSEVGEAMLRGASNDKSPLSAVPEGAVSDLDALHRVVTERGQSAKEFHVDFDGIRYRVSKIEAQEATWYALRKAKSPVPRLSELKINPQIMKYLAMVGRRHGLLVVAGRTGEGKTTTISSLMQEYMIAFGDVGITIEDPPELPLEGNHGKFGKCFQIAVQNGDFGSAMISTMRYNPRYIMLGEIRGPQEASAALRAAVSGHLVLSTIHAGSVQEAIHALIKLATGQDGSEMARHILSEGLAGVIHQSMHRKPGTSERKLILQWLFTGNDKGIRSLIRQGNIEQLSSAIDLQYNRVLKNQLPVEL